MARLPLYHRVLTGLAARGVATVSSDALAAACRVTGAQVRKDLSRLGSYGTRGVGYDVAFLLDQVARELGLTQTWPVVIVGVGNLGRALANYRGFGSRGFRVVGLVDGDPARVGERVGAPGAELTVRPLRELEAVVSEAGTPIGVIATPASAAQLVCDRLVGAGVTSILTFAPAVLAAPPEVEVRRVDVALELQILAFHALRRTLADPVAEVAP